VIDISTNAVIGTILVSIYPYDIAITPDGKYAYLTIAESDEVSVIDTSTNAVVETISVGNWPRGIAITPDGRYAYVTNSMSNTVSMIDTSTNAVVGSPIPVGACPLDIAITPIKGSAIPTIDIILNGTEFHTDDTITIDAHVTNGNEEVDVEGKCWVRFPDDELVSLLNVYEATLPPEFDVTIPLLPGGYTFTGDEPAGDYKAGGRLACPITLDYFSTDIETFTFTP
jgi:YVTN family beta-propeller protein